MNLLKLFKSLIKSDRKKIPIRLNGVWYNSIFYIPREEIDNYNHLRIHDEKGQYIKAEVGNIHKYHFADGREAYYKLVDIHQRSSGDYLFDSDSIYVDLELYKLISPTT